MANFFGEIFEAYIGLHLEKFYDHDHLHFEPKYGKEHRRGPDWIVIEGNRAVLIECRTSRLRKETKSRAEFDDVQKDLSTNSPFPCPKSIDLYSKHLRRCARP